MNQLTGPAATAAEAAFLALVDGQGARPASGASWQGNKKPYPLICANGHDCAPHPSSVRQGQGVCSTCAGRNTRVAEAAFLAKIDALGARPAPGAVWRGNHRPYPLICANGHNCSPRPTHTLAGVGICRTCAGNDTRVAETAFLARLAEHGGHPAPGARWQGVSKLYPAVCANGHGCAPDPGSVLRGNGICRTCSGVDTQATKQAFLTRVREVGARPAEGAQWRGNKSPYPLVCKRGHSCSPRPGGVLSGQGICRTCAGTDTKVAEASFLATIMTLGACPADGAQWRGVSSPYPLICANGHACSPWPASVQQGHGICRICAGLDSSAAEAAFLATIEALGARPAAGAQWRGNKTHYSLVCAAGHDCAPMPNKVQQGMGVCSQCDVHFDRVYLLRHRSLHAIKVGIASGPSRVRKHQGRGYVVLAEWRELTHVMACGAEYGMIASWRRRGVLAVSSAPLDGRTETAPAGEDVCALEWLTEQLGPPTVLVGLLLSGRPARPL
jgi:hypothetical protein